MKLQTEAVLVDGSAVMVLPTAPDRELVARSASDSAFLPPWQNRRLKQATPLKLPFGTSTWSTITKVLLQVYSCATMLSYYATMLLCCAVNLSFTEVVGESRHC